MKKKVGSVERIVVAQVHIQNLEEGKANPDLVSRGYRFYLSSRTHAGQSVYLLKICSPSNTEPGLRGA